MKQQKVNENQNGLFVIDQKELSKESWKILQDAINHAKRKKGNGVLIIRTK